MNEIWAVVVSVVNEDSLVVKMKFMIKTNHKNKNELTGVLEANIKVLL